MTTETTHEVIVAYVLPEGQKEQEGTREAMRDVLRICQKYYLDQVGRTFEIADDWFHVVTSTADAEDALDWSTNVDLLRSELADRYVTRKNLVISVIEGAMHPDAGGSWNVVKMPGNWLDTVRNTHRTDPIRLSNEIAGWAHEMGHAFGLAHTHYLVQLCRQYDVDFVDPGNTLMHMRPNDADVRPRNVFDYPLADLERRLLIDETLDQRLLPLRSDPDHADRKRPHPSVFLRAEHVDAYPDAFGHTVRAVEMGTPRTDTAHGYLVQDGEGWDELDHDFKKVFAFREVTRDDWSVHLRDLDRNVDLQVDLHRHKVRYSHAGSDPFDLYDVLFAV